MQNQQEQFLHKVLLLLAKQHHLQLLLLGRLVLTFCAAVDYEVSMVFIRPLAWAIGKVCVDLGTADYLVSILQGNLDPRLLPALVFILAAGISFSTRADL